MTSNFSFPTDIRFGPGTIDQIGKELAKAGVKRPLLVTDQILSELPIFERLKKILNSESLDVHVYTDFVGNPVKSQVENGAHVFTEHSCDSVVIMGGGAALDVGKVIALQALYQGDLFDFEDGKGKEVDFVLPFTVAIPTTAGTGSEVGRSSVISDDETHEKKIIFSPKLLADLVIADPELTVDLPAKVTASTGMDALTHNIEAFLSPGFHPMCDGIALEAIALISKSLVKAVSSPKDIEARSEMLMGALMGAVAFQKGLGLNHSLAHSLSTVCDLHHGLANAIVLPHVIDFNKDAGTHKYRVIYKTIHGVNSDPEISDEPYNGDWFSHWVRDLNRKIGIPATLSHVGVLEENLNDLTEIAFKDPCHQSNIKPVTKEEMAEVYKRALG